MTDPKKKAEEENLDPNKRGSGDIDSAGPYTDEELVEEWEFESFPASDPPQNY
ncbi:hypothetical protein [Corynebacterium stationis]|uniref:hypothetical protein n=1 Tax=Corynebacterium stationis TaxID=1705 RepID=UPI000A58367A|nr:hypothetical protein [Corynebacterium stationis]HJG64729.1 hypothetical protein [Corynebacterium stationis]